VTTASRRMTLVASVLGSSIVALDATFVTVALPRIGQQLPHTLFGTLEAQSYVYNGYLLALGSLLVLAGALSDFYDRRRTFLVGLMSFGVISVLCGLSPSIEVLIVLRVLQGAAGALLVPGSLALLRTAYADEESQGRAYGTWAGAGAATTILGPLVGGFLVDTISWRAAFLINAPLVAVAVWATVTYVAESRDEQASGAFDWPGAAIVAIALGGLSFGAIYGQQREWRDALGYVGLAAGGLAAAALPWYMARARHPLIPLSLFRSRNFSVSNVSTLLVYGALYVTIAYLPLYLQGTLGLHGDRDRSGNLAGLCVRGPFAAIFGRLGGRYGPRWFMAVGPVIMALGLVWLARAPIGLTAWSLRPDQVTKLCAACRLRHLNSPGHFAPGFRPDDRGGAADQRSHGLSTRPPGWARVGDQ
jgi:MFS family permease